MLLERRIETTSLRVFFHFLVANFGLDTAGERRLLDQRIALETNCRVASEKYIFRKTKGLSNYCQSWILPKNNLRKIKIFFAFEESPNDDDQSICPIKNLCSCWLHRRYSP